MSALAARWSVLDFWAPGAGLRPDDPGARRLHGRLGSPAASASSAINSDGGGATARRHQGVPDRASITYPVVRDGDGEVGARYRLRRCPNIVGDRRDGRIRGSFIGLTMQGTLEKALRDATEGGRPNGRAGRPAQPHSRRAVSSVK
jgi:hypothetical protein